MFDTFAHKWLKVPYRLNIHSRQIVNRSRATIIFLHGIGNSGESWEKIITQLPNDVNAITIDLLGHGSSAKPSWAKYDVRTQARSVITTLISLRLRGRVTIVGHSLGALVAIEVTKRYPVIVRSLVLCSPPLYDLTKDKVVLVGAAFKQIKRNPQRFVKLVATARKYKLVKKTFLTNDESIHSYVETLQASILTQTSLEDVVKLKKPMTIIHGSADPWVKKRNLIYVTRNNPRASLVVTQSGHEVRGLYPKAVLRSIKIQTEPTVKTNKVKRKSKK